MRIVEIRGKTISMASAIANAYIDFSKMTCSVVALITDVVRDGRPVIGYGSRWEKVFDGQRAKTVLNGETDAVTYNYEPGNVDRS